MNKDNKKTTLKKVVFLFLLYLDYVRDKQNI